MRKAWGYPQTRKGITIPRLGKSCGVRKYECKGGAKLRLNAGAENPAKRPMVRFAALHFD